MVLNIIFTFNESTDDCIVHFRRLRISQRLTIEPFKSVAQGQILSFDTLSEDFPNKMLTFG
ncbi:hypothetical protein XBO1_830003 [Xenorhabdus bovienii str. oregonense]|uniref:Uncharacterized protein n=1 Tax=Xenorhabdus bovienii str. oregonense TaxID=1398202 RepID=A0A077PBC6_XENBV|nr:hypothetical protein XBO1_830003 [Xenorhabdus bovienii str. oregonense]